MTAEHVRVARASWRTRGCPSRVTRAQGAVEPHPTGHFGTLWAVRRPRTQHHLARPVRSRAGLVPMSEVGGIFDADRHGAFAHRHGVGRPAVVVTVLPERSS